MATSFPVVGLHLDLKYLMPNKQYLLRWLEEIRDCGINTLLLEYEDKFPWTRYPFLRGLDAFTPDELRQFLGKARALGLRVVPLVQTLSHLEFALAHEELAHLREMPEIWTQINPSNPEAVQFVHDLIEEVLEYHEDDEWFHLGADETWFLGTNPVYAAEVKAMGAPAYWARHTRIFVDKIVARDKRPVVWDDVLWRGLPRAVAPDFPQQTILGSWDYGERKFKPGMYPQVDVFREAGFDVLGVSCLNWGVLTPMHDHCLENTVTWTEKARESGLLGVINSSWASFHTPLPTQMLHVAATSALLEEGCHAVDTAWETRFLEDFFGAPAEGMPQALRQLGTNWEQQVGMPRPITPIVYGFMDLMLFYPNGLTDRKQHGGYPLDWNEVDVVSVYRQKMELLRRPENIDAARTKLDELQTLYDAAEGALADFLPTVTRHHDEVRLLLLFAEMKSLHARIVRLLVLGEGDRAALIAQHSDLFAPIMDRLLPFYEPAAVQRLHYLWWVPANAVLQEASEAASEPRA